MKLFQDLDDWDGRMVPGVPAGVGVESGVGACAATRERVAGPAHTTMAVAQTVMATLMMAGMVATAWVASEAVKKSKTPCQRATIRILPRVLL